MDRNTARVIAAIFAALAFLLAIFGTIIRYSRGKPTDYFALIGALFCLFFLILVLRGRGKK